VEWLTKQHETVSRRVLVATEAEANILVRNKGKRKIIENTEKEQSFKFRVGPLMQKEAFAIRVKTQKHNKRTAQR